MARTTDDSQDDSSTPSRIAEPLVEAVTRRLESGAPSVFVAIDGRSGAGKSTIAEAVAADLEARAVSCTVIEGDEFYAGGTAEQWDQQSAAEKADRVIDWRRQHQVLVDLRANGKAVWFAFDWAAPDWSAETAPLATTPTTASATDVVILEGAYSARPELHDLLDMLILLDTPSEQRRRQLLQREGDEYRSDWEGRWSAAEDHYFGTIMLPERFDHVLR